VDEHESGLASRPPWRTPAAYGFANFRVGPSSLAAEQLAVYGVFIDNLFSPFNFLKPKPMRRLEVSLLVGIMVSLLLASCQGVAGRAPEPPVRAVYLETRPWSKDGFAHDVRIILLNREDVPVWFIVPYRDESTFPPGVFPGNGSSDPPFHSDRHDGEGGSAIEVYMSGALPNGGFAAYRLPAKGRLELARIYDARDFAAWEDIKVNILETRELMVNGKTPLEKWLPYGTTSGANVKLGYFDDPKSLDWDPATLKNRIDYPSEKVTEVRAEGFRIWQVKLEAPTPSFEDKASGFQLEVPKRWTAVKRGWGYVGDDMDVTVNNQRADLHVQTEGPRLGDFATGEYFLPTDIDPKLQPGEISLEIIGRTPSGPPSLSVIHPDSIGADLRPLLAAHPIEAFPGSDLSRLSFVFVKCGRIWSVVAKLRAPIGDGDRQNLLSALASMRFADAPVGNELWAESLALPHLPARIRDWKPPGGPDRDFGWPAFPARGGNQDVTVTEEDEGYIVRFYLNESVGWEPRKWEYLVANNGTVTAMSVPATKQPATGGPAAP